MDLGRWLKDRKKDVEKRWQNSVVLDAVSANTKADQARRVQAGQAEQFKGNAVARGLTNLVGANKMRDTSVQDAADDEAFRNDLKNIINLRTSGQITPAQAQAKAINAAPTGNTDYTKDVLNNQANRSGVGQAVLPALGTFSKPFATGLSDIGTAVGTGVEAFTPFNGVGKKIADVSKRQSKGVEDLFRASSFNGGQEGENRLVTGLSSGLGSLASSLATGATGGLKSGVGMKLSTGGRQLLNPTTMSGLQFGLSAGAGQMRDATDNGKSAGRAFGTGVVAGGVEAALEKVGLDKYLGAGGNFARRTGTRMLTEGLQEGSQSLAQSAVSGTYKKVNPVDALKQAALEGGMGGLVGGIGGVGGDISLNLQQKSNPEVQQVKQEVVKQSPVLQQTGIPAQPGSIRERIQIAKDTVTNKIANNSLANNQDGFVQVGRTPSKIHPQDQQIMDDYVAHVRGYGDPLTEAQATELELTALHIADRYGMASEDDSPKVIASNFDKRLTKDNYIGPDVQPNLKNNQSGSVQIPDFISNIADRIKNSSLNKNQDGFLRIPGKDTELMVTHNLSSDNLAKAQELGGIPQASIGIVDPKKSVIDGYGDITLVGNQKLVDPKSRGTSTYASDVYSPRQPRAKTYVKDRKPLDNKLKDFYAKTGEEPWDIETDDIANNLYDSVASKAAFLESRKIKPEYSKEEDKYYRKRDNGTILSRKIEESGLLGDYQKYVDETLSELNIENKLFAGHTPSGNRRELPETIDNILKIMRQEAKRGGDNMGGIGRVRSKVTPKFNSVDEINQAKNRLTTNEKMNAVKEILDNKFNKIIDSLDQYATNRSDNQFTEYDSQMEIVGDYLMGDRQWFNQKYSNVPPKVIAKLDAFKKELQTSPTEYFESVSDRAVKLNEFEKALIPMDTPKSQREEIVKQLKEQGIQPVFYEKGKRQEVLQQLLDEDNQNSKPETLDKKQGGYAKNPFYDKKNDIAQDLSPEQSDFINEYANMLENMGQDNGVAVNPETGQRISNNYRTAENKGKAMSKADWFEQARQDLESGKGAYGASEDYKKLPSQTSQPKTLPPQSQQKAPLQGTRKTPEIKQELQTTQKELTPTKDKSKSLVKNSLDKTIPNIDEYVKNQVNEQESKPEKTGRIAKLKRTWIDSLSPAEDKFRQAVKDGKMSQETLDDIIVKNGKSLRAGTAANLNLVDSGLVDLLYKKSKTDYDNLGQTLIAIHSNDLRANGIETGRTAEIDKQIIDSYGKKFEGEIKQFRDATNYVLDKSVESQLISKETATMLKKKYPNYVPMNRVIEEIENNGSFGSKQIASIGQQTVVRKIKGSKRVVENPMESMISKVQDMTRQSLKNDAALTWVDALSKTGDAELVTGTVKPGESTISVLRNGKKEIYKVDPEMEAAAKGLSKEQMGTLTNAARKVSRVFKTGTTGLNLPFIVTNLARDQQNALLNQQKGEFETFKAIPSAIMETLGHGKLYEEAVRNGAVSTSFDLTKPNLKRTAEHIRKQGDKLGALDKIEDVIGRSEEYTRIQQYKATKEYWLKKGLSEAEAQNKATIAAQQNSADFARSGDLGQILNAWLPYTNAGAQGTRSTLRAAKNNPVGYALKAGAMLVMPAIMTTLWNTDDEERKKIYDDISENDKQANFIVVTPWATKNEEGKWQGIVKIPKPPGISALIYPVEKGVASMKGSDPVAFKDIVKGVLGFGSPLGDNLNAAVSTMTPQALKPAAESIINKNLFTGRDIVPYWLNKKPANEQVYEGSSGTARAIGKATGISPIKVEHMIRGYGGEMGLQFLNASDNVLAKAGVIPEEQIGGISVPAGFKKRFTEAYDKPKSKVKSTGSSDSSSKITEINQKTVDKNNALKESLSADDYEISKMTKEEKRQVVEAGIKTQEQMDGLDNYIKAKKKELGIVSGSTSAITYKEKYKTALTAYEKEKNSLSPVQRSVKEKELRKLNVQKDYDNDTVSLHGMSKKDVYGLVSTDKNGNDLVKKLIAYDDALVKSGVLVYNKWRDKNGNVDIMPRTKGGRSGGGRSAKSQSQSAVNSLTQDTLSKLNSLLAGVQKPVSGTKRVATSAAKLKKITVKK